MYHRQRIRGMLKNYFKIAWRNLVRHKAFAGINIIGLVLGLAAFWMIALYVANELSYDRYHANTERIYRVVQYTSWENNPMQLALTSAPFGPALQAAFPEIKAFVRVVPEGGGVITYGSKRLKADDVYLADKNIFRIFSYSFLYGNPATALAKPHSIVLTQSLAIKIFGRAALALNKTIKFNDQVINVVTGVIADVPPNSHIQFSALQSLPTNFK